MKAFDTNNLRVKTNLETNNSISCYMEYCAQQNPYAFEVFYKFLQEVRPKRILEIGTGMGGFTNFLQLVSDECDLNIDLTTVDKNESCSHKQLLERNINVLVENYFNEDYTSVSQVLIDYIKRDGCTIVLCDGGSKIGEFNLLSDHLKTGDFIMAHDYASNRDYFLEFVDKKLWNWHEIQDSDISNAVERNNLLPYMAEEFQKAVWVCKIKS